MRPVIRDLIFRKTKLTASAGIAPNKLVAKIASDLKKPNGQYEVWPNEVPGFMAALPVRKIWGIGAVTEQKLQQRGITTCGELQRFSRVELQNIFGKFGAELYDLCRGMMSGRSSRIANANRSATKRPFRPISRR